MRIICCPFVNRSSLRAFLKDPLLKKMVYTHPEYKPAKNNDSVANRALSFKRISI
jgi:hypothetical protein